MNANLAHTLDSLFGPPSDIINVSEFLESSRALTSLPENEQSLASDVIEQCRYSSTQTILEMNSLIATSVHDIRDSLEGLWSNPTLSAHLIKDHDHTVTALHSISQRNTKSARKTHLPDPDTIGAEVAHLQKSLASVALKSFK